MVKGRFSTFVLICMIGCSVSMPGGAGMVECILFCGCRNELREVGAGNRHIITHPFCPTYIIVSLCLYVFSV